MNNKILLRENAKSVRKTLKLQDISEKIVSNIKLQTWYKSARNVMIFYPLSDEINLMSLAIQDKNFYLPRVNGDDIEICPYKAGDELVTSKWGISEPKTSPVNLAQIDIIFTPALMIDKNFHRLGYGGGFYDRLMKDYAGVKAGVIPEKLYVDSIPVGDYDIPLDCVITETAVYPNISD